MVRGQRSARWLVAAFIIGAICAHVRVCRAGGSDAEKVEELIRQGNALRRQHEDARALPMFQQAYELSRTPRTAAQLGLAELALGYWDAAHEHLTDGLTSGRNSWVTQNRRALEAALTEAKSHLASVTIEGTPAGADVLLNGKSVGTLPLPAPVLINEGRIEVDVRAATYKADHRVLTVQGNSPVQISVNLQTAAVASAAAQPVEGSSPTTAPVGEAQAPVAPATKNSDTAESDAELPTWRRILPWALSAGAIVAGGIGIWQAVEASHSLTKFQAVQACGADDPNHGSDPSCPGLYDTWSSHRTNAWIGFGTAGVLAAGAVTMFIWNAQSSPVDVQVGPNTARIEFRHTF
ncbi:MAG: PEGA domain-containing protein [Polyangia bacterium]